MLCSVKLSVVPVEGITAAGMSVALFLSEYLPYINRKQSTLMEFKPVQVI